MSEDSPSIQRHLDAFQSYLCDFLGTALPGICSGGADWWEVMVRSARLQGAQKSRIKSGACRELGKLDLVSLCSLLKHHWRAITQHAGIEDDQREGELHCDGLINLRNRLSHKGAGNQLSPEEELHAMLSLIKLSQLLKAPAALVGAFETDKQRIARQLSGAPAGAPPTAENQPTDPGQVSWDRPLPPPADQGIPLEILSGDGETGQELEAALAASTFIGIDFGTSTTVASRVYVDPAKGILTTEPIPIPQIDRMGRTIEAHLVPSCVSWYEGQLLVGQGAAELKTELSAGMDTWFSFKMELGVDLGPKYTRSKLDGREGRIELLTPQQVATEFFRYLREHIEAWVASRGLPADIRYAVSVPAAFEANQRLDLCRVMAAAGIKVEDSSIIDEPNAAFISHLLDSLVIGDGVLKAFRDRSANVLVFDFGAGTCDISVLQVGCKDERLVSKNLAISQFRALGGDNIDRQIARKVLWPAIVRACLTGEDRIREAELEQVIIPRLQPVAEKLKVQCCKRIEARAQGGDLSAYRQSDELITTAAIPPIRVRGMELSLPEPGIRLKEFFEVMAPFLSPDLQESGDPNVISILDPIENALQKAELTKDQLDMVLFIGGSAQNPLVQESVRGYFGRFVECVIGQDVRTPVSRGAALHSLAWNGLDLQFIRPITSETIYILTAGGVLHPVIPAGSPIPSAEVAFTDQLIVPNDNQDKVQLPICVSSATKMLHILEVTAPAGGSFQAGDRITVSSHLDENKLLHLSAKIGPVMAKGTLLNPLANIPVTPEERRRLIARQKLNESIVGNGGKPDPKVLLEFAKVCGQSGSHLEAAESYEALERIDAKFKTPDNATCICYHYAHCKKAALSDSWAEESYRRRPTWVGAFNLALTKENTGQDEEAFTLLQEADRQSSGNPIVLEALGDRLIKRGQSQEGTEALKRALAGFRDWMERGVLDKDDRARAKRLAGKLKDQQFLKELADHEARSPSGRADFSEAHLAASMIRQNRTD